MRRTTHAFITLFLMLALLEGCSTQTTSETVSRETVQYSTERSQEPVVIEERTTERTESTSRDEHSGGLLSGTAHVVGETLALPFRAVAGLLRVIF